MIKNNNGFSLTVLVITIAVIVIITSTAVISMRNMNKDKAISEFMTDLADVKQYVIEYVGKESTIPAQIDSNGLALNAENELINTIAAESQLSQIDETDSGAYYYVDLTKLGKIHLSNEGRGYIVNEGTLNIYVTTPTEYNGTKYFTLTPELLGKDLSIYATNPFEITIIGNPITWTDRAEILVVIPNIAVGETDDWNFKWLKGDHTLDDFSYETTVNYFNYGDEIKLTENGVYTIYVENPERRASIRKLVVTKIDDIAPTIQMVDGKLVVDDAQTGVKTIRYKIKETASFNISAQARADYPEYYTADRESGTDTPAQAVSKYLWGDEKIKGDTIDKYFEDYERYLEDFSEYNEIATDSEATEDAVANAKNAIKVLNSHYPQFAYNNQAFPSTEKNIVIYVEDMCGNGTVYSALNRNELSNVPYRANKNGTLTNGKVIINNNNLYTNTRSVTLNLKAPFATHCFVTEEKVDTATWEEFDSSRKNFTLSEGDGEKTVYAFFKDEAGKIVNSYDKIILDATPPTNTAPTVTVTSQQLAITCNQTDRTTVKDNLLIRYGVKSSDDVSVKWYDKLGNIPNLESDKSYYILTKATDEAGNAQISKAIAYHNGSVVGEKEFVTVNFNANGGTVNVASMDCMVGQKYGNLPTPTREGYTFLGWNGKNLFDEESILMAVPEAVYQNEHYIFDVVQSRLLYSTVYGDGALNGLKENTQYTVKVTGYATGTMNGTLHVGFAYTDESPSTAKFLSNTTEEDLVITSDMGKTVKCLWFSYGRGGNTNIRHIQVEEGTEATEYEPYYITSTTEVVQSNDHTLTAIWKEN